MMFLLLASFKSVFFFLRKRNWTFASTIWYVLGELQEPPYLFEPPPGLPVFTDD